MASTKMLHFPTDLEYFLLCATRVVYQQSENGVIELLVPINTGPNTQSEWTNLSDFLHWRNVKPIWNVKLYLKPDPISGQYELMLGYHLLVRFKKFCHQFPGTFAGIAYQAMTIVRLVHPIVKIKSQGDVWNKQWDNQMVYANIKRFD